MSPSPIGISDLETRGISECGSWFCNFGGTMDDASTIRVLLVGDSPQSFYLCQKHLERNGCECEFADCERSVWDTLEQRQFDLVFSLRTDRGTRNLSLAILLNGLPTTLFYVLRVEEGCWWVPILILGEECFGAPALRPKEFANALDAVLKEIRTAANATEQCSMRAPGFQSVPLSRRLVSARGNKKSYAVVL